MNGIPSWIVHRGQHLLLGAQRTSIDSVLDDRSATLFEIRCEGARVRDSKTDGCAVRRWRYGWWELVRVVAVGVVWQPDVGVGPVRRRRRRRGEWHGG